MFKLEIDTSNAAFEDSLNAELGFLLRNVAHKVEHNGQTEGNIRDSSGNTVGSFKLS